MPFKEKYWHSLFEATVVLKAINGLWETVSGFALLFLTKAAINNSFISLTKKELVEDPQDKIIHFFNLQLQHLSSGTKDFAAIYLLIHGILNFFLAYNLYRDRLWAYLFSMVFSTLFTFYLIYRVSHSHSAVLLGIIIFDILFTILTLHEYRYRKGKINDMALQN